MGEAKFPSAALLNVSHPDIYTESIDCEWNTVAAQLCNNFSWLYFSREILLTHMGFLKLKLKYAHLVSIRNED